MKLLITRPFWRSAINKDGVLSNFTLELQRPGLLRARVKVEHHRSLNELNFRDQANRAQYRALRKGLERRVKR